MSNWTIGVPLVDVPRRQAPKRVTLIVPYYDQPKFFATQIAGWRAYAPALQQHLRIIVVDDGSPHAMVSPEFMPFPFRMFRIETDIPWNWLAARNIGAHHAETEWILLTDMDHVLPDPTLEALIYGQHDPSIVYAFSRREHTGHSISPHSASFFLTRALFWEIGGYDERLSGVYGTDGSFRKRVSAVAPMHILRDELIRHEYVGDSSVTRYERKTPAMRAQKQRRFQLIPAGSKPTVLTFPYHEVAL